MSFFNNSGYFVRSSNTNQSRNLCIPHFPTSPKCPPLHLLVLLLVNNFNFLQFSDESWSLHFDPVINSIHRRTDISISLWIIVNMINDSEFAVCNLHLFFWWLFLLPVNTKYLKIYLILFSLLLAFKLTSSYQTFTEIYETKFFVTSIKNWEQFIS